MIPHRELTRTEVCFEDNFSVRKESIWNKRQVAVTELKAKVDFKPELLKKEIQHPNLAKIYGVCIETEHYSIVMELSLHITLYDLLHNGQNLSWRQKLDFAKGIVEGLAYLHGQELLHSMLTTRNVLIKHQSVKITNPSLARIKYEVSTISSSLYWMAPELFSSKAYSSKASDIFAFGMLLWELAAQRTPYEANEAEIHPCIEKRIKEGEHPVIPQGIPRSFAVLMERCWQKRAEHRPRVENVSDDLKCINSN